MSATELTDLRARIVSLTKEERDELRAYLHFLKLRDDPEWRARIAASFGESSHSQEEVEALHQRLCDQGR